MRDGDERAARARIDFTYLARPLGASRFGIRGTRHDEPPRLFLAGHGVYEVERYQTGPGLVSALLATLALVASDHAAACEHLAPRRKRLEDLWRELARPFEHEGRLTALLARQRELLQALDLTKDEAGSTALDADDEKRVA